MSAPSPKNALVAIVLLQFALELHGFARPSLPVTNRATMQASAAYVDEDAWRKGYTTCPKETCEPLDASFPKDLKGTYYKNGGAKFEFGKELVTHMFDADGMVIGVTIQDGKAMFRNRFVRTKGYVEDSKYRRILNRGVFGTKKSGFLANFLDLNFKNTANTNVVYWDGKVLALQESGLPHYLEPDSLRTLGVYTFRGQVKKGRDTHTAHPKVDPKSNRLIAFTSKRTDPSQLCIRELDASLQPLASRDVTFKGFAFFHDFAVTENMYVFSQPPVTLDPVPMILGLKGPAACISFDASKPSVLHLIPRDGSPAALVEVPAHFAFHCCNAFEEDDRLILDLASSSAFEMAAESTGKPVWMTVDYAKVAPFTRLERYTLRKAGGAWKLESKRHLSQQYIEFPSVNPLFATSKHRYIYAACGSTTAHPSPLQGLLKLDVVAQTEQSWIGAPHEFIGEPIFVPREGGDGGAAEDDGYVMCTLHDCKNMLTHLLVFDAQNIAAGPVVRALLPVFVPLGLHGTYANGVTHKFDDIARRFKATKALDSKSWNEVNSGFSGIGISQDF